jgi:hypothetical protein
VHEDLPVVPWYPDASCYEQFRRSAVDRSDFFPSFADWRQAALRHEARAHENGVCIVRVRIGYDEFEQWRQACGRLNDSVGRGEFAVARARTLLAWKFAAGGAAIDRTSSRDERPAVPERRRSCPS